MRTGIGDHEARPHRVRKREPFCELLRADAPEEEIRQAAHEVQADPAAREDVHRHRVELAQTYAAALDSDDDVLNAVFIGTSKRGGR